MPLFLTTVPVTLPSGELADFSFWGQATDLSLAVSGVDAWYVALAGDITFKSHFTADTSFGAAKVSEVGVADGKVITSSLAGTAFAGTSISPPLPPQVAVVCSINTAILSRTTRGRFYLPAPDTSSVTTTGRITSGTQTALLESLSEAFVDMAGQGLALCVYSRKERSVQAATTIDVGDVFDTMRTRRDKLVELRVFADAT